MSRLIPQMQDWRSARRVATCVFHTGYHDGVSVEIYDSNERQLKFSDDAGWIESIVPCKGPLPSFEKREAFIHDSKHGSELDCEDKTVREILGCREPQSLQNGLHTDRVMLSALQDCAAKPPKVLLLGLGGGYYHTAISQTCPQADVLSLEPSKTIVKAARDFFGFIGKVDIVGADMGIRRLINDKQKFDVVVSDMGQHGFSLQEMSAASKVLKPGGIVIYHECYTRREDIISSLTRFFTDVKDEADPKLNHCKYYTAKNAMGISSEASLEEGWSAKPPESQ
jgi:SAM-dependent methyltransferase